MKKTHEFWNTVEIAYLKELRQDGRPIKGISKALRRTFWSVAKKLHELNIRQPNRKRRERKKIPVN